MGMPGPMRSLGSKMNQNDEQPNSVRAPGAVVSTTTGDIGLLFAPRLADDRWGSLSRSGSSQASRGLGLTGRTRREERAGIVDVDRQPPRGERHSWVLTEGDRVERCGECGTLAEPPTCFACGAKLESSSLWSAAGTAAAPAAPPVPQQRVALTDGVDPVAPAVATPRRSYRSVALVAVALLLASVGTAAFLVGRGSDGDSVGAPAAQAAEATDVRGTPAEQLPASVTSTVAATVTPAATPSPIVTLTTTVTPAVTPSPIVFPYDWYDVPALNGAEPGAMGSGCDTENMGDGLWHGFVTSFDEQTMGFDRACALIPYALENKSDRVRVLSVSPAYAVYQATWTNTGCNAFVPAALDAGHPVWIEIQGGQVQWALIACTG